jgi:hypothetical protein
MTTLEEKIKYAKELGIKFELRAFAAGEGFKKEEYDVIQFYECWTDDFFEERLNEKILNHERITFIKLLQKYDLLDNEQLII